MTMIDIETQPTTLPVDLIEQGWRLERKRDNPSFPYRAKNDRIALYTEAYAFAHEAIARAAELNADHERKLEEEERVAIAEEAQGGATASSEPVVAEDVA